mgnify:CR=1 FL=1
MIAILQSYSSMLLGALGKTLLLTLLSLLFAMIIGMIFALMNVGRNRVLNCIGTIYVDAVRGVPLIVLAYFIYFGVPSGMKMMGATDFRLSALQAGTIALAMNCGAYMAEIIRAGIQSVDKGQMEAGRSVGLTYATTMRCVIIPQAFKNVLPALGNELITLLKETSVVTVIGLRDLTKGALIIQSKTYQAFVPFFAIAAMYLVMVLGLSWLMGKLERRMRQSDLR